MIIAAIRWLWRELLDNSGSPGAILLVVVVITSSVIFFVMYKRYIGVLGAGGGRKGYPAREAYEALRASLSGGNLASRLYADWLTKFLDAVDRLFGDADKADQTLFPRAFGLKTPVPLWTAPAFDRCLLLALVYPIIAVFIMWAVSGHVGPAEEALSLPKHLPGWRRGLSVAAFASCWFAWGRFVLARGWRSFVWYIVAVAVAVALAGAVALPIAGAVALGLASAVAVASVGAVTVAVAGAFAAAMAVAVAGALAGAGALSVAVLAAFAFAFAVAVVGPVLLLTGTFVEYRWHGTFLLMFSVAVTSGCMGAAHVLAPLPIWRTAGPWLLFFGLLTMLNAPFDWASLGLTRALLRRGLELKSWWPFVLALVDALSAAVIVAVLALTMVIGVQTFDALAVHGGGEPVLPLDALFDGISAHPGAPEYWWVYALLLSTMIPSLLNLMIGGASLLRGIPGLPALLLRFMPVGKAVPAFDRTWLALVLTCQVFVGAFLGIAAQFVLAVGVIFYVLPWMGLELLETARAVVEFDLPGRVLGVFWGNP